MSFTVVLVCVWGGSGVCAWRWIAAIARSPRIESCVVISPVVCV